MLVDQSCLRRRFLLRAAALLGLVSGGGAIDWGETTSSTSADPLYYASVGELITVVIEPSRRANIIFESEPSNHFAVSYRQCSTEAAQPIQWQYAGFFDITTYLGGCYYVENELAQIESAGCPFYRYNPTETLKTYGEVYQGRELLEPGRVRLENRGDANATVDVVLFSSEVTAPVGLVNDKVWIEEDFLKKDRVVNASLNIYLNKDVNYCDVYGCLISGWVNEYVEGQDSLSLCEVQADPDALWHEPVPFTSNPVQMAFELPENKEYYVTMILSADERTNANYTEMIEYDLDQIVVFQTDTTLPDSSAQKLLASLSLASLAWVVILNVLLAASGREVWLPSRQGFPALGW